MYSRHPLHARVRAVLESMAHPVEPALYSGSLGGSAITEDVASINIARPPRDRGWFCVTSLRSSAGVTKESSDGARVKLRANGRELTRGAVGHASVFNQPGDVASEERGEGLPLPIFLPTDSNLVITESVRANDLSTAELISVSGFHIGRQAMHHIRAICGEFFLVGLEASNTVTRASDDLTEDLHVIAWRRRRYNVGAAQTVTDLKFRIGGHELFPAAFTAHTLLPPRFYSPDAGIGRTVGRGDKVELTIQGASGSMNVEADLLCSRPIERGADRVD